MPIAMATGHAAGVTAALASRQHTTPRLVGPELVQRELRRQGAVLGKNVAAARPGPAGYNWPSAGLPAPPVASHYRRRDSQGLADHRQVPGTDPARVSNDERRPAVLSRPPAQAGKPRPVPGSR